MSVGTLANELFVDCIYTTFPLIWQLVDQLAYIWIFQNSVLAMNF